MTERRFALTLVGAATRSLRGLMTSWHVRPATVLLLALTEGTPLLAQPASLAWPLPSAPAYVSVSGVVAVGFSQYREAPSPRLLDPADMVPSDSDIPAICRLLLDDMWRGSATFRRQWIRVAAARVRIAITLDRPWQPGWSRSRSEISAKARLQLRVSLRIVDPEVIEYLAHELEHVIEQLDGVDLARAMASHVHGATATGRPPAFETRRAVVIGRLVASEVSAHRDRR
jgi:hypothetical protein